ncbi:MAG: cyclic pyranopterin monophosphate synthase MoaC [Phycisphaerae bacterium]|nr:cyclic pyranopterin monophosphate synthase MoaC [Phycisphaerae bacterium]
MAPESSSFSHLDAHGHARMVDVGAKPETARVAKARARVRVSAELAQAIRSQTLAKGDLFAVARLAGIMAAKRTDELIPLCHTLPLDHVDVRLALVMSDGTGDGSNAEIAIESEARCTSRTGVEMEALVAASVAALTVVDMGKAIDKAMTIHSVEVTEKSGGRSGTWRRVDGGARS